MNRRDLVVLTGGLAVASPAARAQTRTSPRRIGLLLQRDSLFDLPRWRSAMAERGLVEGTAYVVEVKSAGGRAGVLDGLADDLVRARVDLIVAVQTPAAVAAKRATRDIPIVALTGDPVGTGLVASHARPGGNVTGIDSSSAEIGGKWVELLRELLPACRRVGVMANPPDPFAAPFIEGTRRAGAGIGVEIEVFPADNPTTLDATIDAMLAAKTDAAIVQPSLSVARIAALTRSRPAGHLPTARLRRRRRPARLWP